MNELVWSDNEDEQTHTPEETKSTPFVSQSLQTGSLSSLPSRNFPGPRFDELDVRSVRKFEDETIQEKTESQDSQTQHPSLSSDTEELQLSISSKPSDYEFTQEEEEKQRSPLQIEIDEVLTNQTPIMTRIDSRHGSSGRVIQDSPEVHSRPSRILNTIGSDNECSPLRRNITRQLTPRKLSLEQTKEEFKGISPRATTVASYRKAVAQSQKKTMSKGAKSEQEICMVCMGNIDYPARPSNCTHLFCLECLKQWALETNVCPLCRVEFRGIIMSSGEKAVSVAKQKFRLPAEYYDQDVQAFINEVCMYCQDDDDQEALMICDECGTNLAHTFCIGLTEVPQEDWYCQYCKPQFYSETHQFIRESERGRRTRSRRL